MVQKKKQEKDKKKKMVSINTGVPNTEIQRGAAYAKDSLIVLGGEALGLLATHA